VVNEFNSQGEYMPILNSAARLAAKPFPQAIPPQAHAIIDYISVACFLVSGAWFFGRNKRAAVGALVSGGAALVINLLTDYPGGLRKSINFPTHRDIDFGLAAMAASMPEFLAFKDDDPRKFFLIQGMLISAVAELTKCSGKATRGEKKRAPAA
jgi:hypothetical protein